MSDKDQGGFVYPSGQKVVGYDDILPARSGITLRQHYAGLAMQGLLAGQYSENGFLNLREMPDEAFKIADAMIEAGKQ